LEKTFKYTKDIEGWGMRMTVKIFISQMEQKILTTKPRKPRVT
jgi:hypothetical protein